MERGKEASITEGLRKRYRPDPQVETTTVDERVAREEKFWDELGKRFGARPIRKDSEDMEAKTAWMKMDLTAELSEAAAAAAASSSEDEDDEPGFDLRRFRNRWNSLWSGGYGDFEDTTLIPPMRYTNEPPNDAFTYCETIQIFSAKIAGLGEGLQWPLDVFGIVAMRDNIDQNRNIIFQRSSLNCQTLTEKDPNLVLTGPSRPVVVAGTIFIEVDLKVKGTRASEDKNLFCRVLPFTPRGWYYSRVLQLTETSKFSTLEFTLGDITSSLEATIFVRVIDGSWPYGFYGEFAACTISADRMGPIVVGTDSVNHKEIVLLGFGPEKGPVTGDGAEIELSRRVVCVDSNSQLEVSIKAWQGDNSIVVDRAGFNAKKWGKSYGKLEVASCRMEVTVAWSLVSRYPEVRWETISKNNRCSS